MCVCVCHTNASSGDIAGKSIKKDLELVGSTAGLWGTLGEQRVKPKGERGEFVAGQRGARVE